MEKIGMGIVERLQKRLKPINEDLNSTDVSWKDPNSPNYDRQWAEDALFHTIGPLTDNPRWVKTSWSSPSEPVPGFVEGGSAPRWTKSEVVFAMAGDPQLAFKPHSRDNPRSPQYGNKGGSPLWRLAKKVARVYKRDQDKSFISDMYSSGFVPLAKMMEPGFDESRSPFISYAMRNIQSAMEHGIGGNEQNIRAMGGDSVTGLKGLESLLKTTNPKEARSIADQVKGEYTTRSANDKHAHNPFGKFSNRFHALAMKYADALESGDEELIAQTKEEINQLSSEIEDDQVFIPGASTGMGQAISTADRKTSVKVGSMDVSADEEKGPMAGNIPSYEEDEDSTINQETIFHVLDVAMGHDLTKWLYEDPELAKVAARMGLKEGEKLGKLTANEFRYLIRNLGLLGSNYPGKGTPRKGTSIPRDKPNWWKPLEDPEIEPIPNSKALWKSIWTRNGYPEMGPTEIAKEMTEEVKEFNKLSIPTAREIKVKAKTEEAVSKMAISNAMQNALLKLKVILYTQRESLGIDENFKKELRSSGIPLMEDYDPVDRRIIFETINYMIRKLTKSIVEDMSTEFSKVGKDKKKTNNDKEFEIAWSTYKNGTKPK